MCFVGKILLRFALCAQLRLVTHNFKLKLCFSRHRRIFPTKLNTMVEYKQRPNTDDEIFNVLHPLVKQWFQTKFKTFGMPQKFAVLDIHSRKNILVSAPTGSGKTLTAFLSVLNELID